MISEIQYKVVSIEEKKYFTLLNGETWDMVTDWLDLKEHEVGSIYTMDDELNLYVEKEAYEQLKKFITTGQ